MKTLHAVTCPTLLPHALCAVVPGEMNETEITALLSGTGLTGTYTVGLSQIAPSQVMGLTTLADDVIMNIDQAPAIAASDVGLALV